MKDVHLVVPFSLNRADILRVLGWKGALRYSDLMNQSGFLSNESARFYYHLRKLVKQGLVEKKAKDDTRKYFLTHLGKLVFNMYLEQTYSKREIQILRNKIRLKPPYPKLSEMWDRASKEFMQIKGSYGWIEGKNKETCASGAIAYYMTKGATLRDYLLEESVDKEGYDDLVSKEKRFCAGAGDSIFRLNDRKGWTFAQFAERARELGV